MLKTGIRTLILAFDNILYSENVTCHGMVTNNKFFTHCFVATPFKLKSIAVLFYTESRSAYCIKIYGCSGSTTNVLADSICSISYLTINRCMDGNQLFTSVFE